MGAVAALTGAVFADEPTDGGAIISVQVGDGGVTTLDVQRGEVKVRAGGQETRVGAGESIQAEKSKLAKHILRAPTNLSPADGTNLSSLDFMVKFDPVPRATAYQITVAEDPQFAQVVWKNERTPATKVSAKVARAGTYYWRVVAVNEKSEAVGKFSSPRKLVIDLTPPKLKAGRPSWK
jgi:hypothetical protein